MSNGRTSSAAWTHESCNRSGWVGAGEPCPICEQEARSAASTWVIDLACDHSNFYAPTEHGSGAPLATAHCQTCGTRQLVIRRFEDGHETC